MQLQPPIKCFKKCTINIHFTIMQQEKGYVLCAENL